jgi:hydrogenase large subunit
MQLNLQVHDHIEHVYHLHALDCDNPVNILRAEPKATSELQQAVSPSHRLSSPGYFRDVHNRPKKFVEPGQLGIFKNGYWDNPACLLPPEADLMATTHYLEALDLQKDIVMIHTIFGGKNPQPNWLVGGVPSPINIDGVGSVGAINMERPNLVSSIIDR